MTSVEATGQPATARPREVVDLGGEWEYEPLARTEFRERGVLVADATDLPAAGRMPVPSNWHDHGLADFHGRVRFSRQLPAVDGNAWWLRLEGVDYLSEVAVDGRVLVRHEGAFDAIDVALPAGAQRLDVTVDAPREELGTLWPYRKRQLKGIFTQWEPMEPFQSTTGGIWGRVAMERRSEVFVDSVSTSSFVVPRPVVRDGAYEESDERDARVLVEVDVVAAEPATVLLAIELCGARAERHITVPAGRSRHRIGLTVEDPRLWWPIELGEPVLHELRVSVGDDVVRRSVGLREVAFDEATGTFSVNGEPLAVRGSNVIPDKWLARYDARRAAADVALVQEANLNAVRVCVHVAADVFYEACDEAGILVWQDLPLQWDYLVDDEVVTQAADQAERIVRRLHDHPCIAVWSCHNEPFPANRKVFAGPLQRAVRAADPTRPVHPASDFTEHVYHGWFAGELRDYALPPPAAIVTEFGALALPSADETRSLAGDGWPPGGRRWDAVLHEPTPLFDVAGVDVGEDIEDLVRSSQHYQAATIQRAIEAYRTTGTSFFHFLFMDGWPTVSWSVLSYDRVPKLGFAALARACQPLLIGAVVTRETLSDAWDSGRFPLIGDVWVVNDTGDALPGARWTATLGGQPAAEGALDVAPRGLSRQGGGGQRWPSWTPPAVPPGRHDLVFELFDASGALRSTNAYPITVVRRGADLLPPR